MFVKQFKKSTYTKGIFCKKRKMKINSFDWKSNKKNICKVLIKKVPNYNKKNKDALQHAS